MKKIFNRKSIVRSLVLVFLLFAFLLPVSARYGMGGATVYKGSTAIGDGYIWNDNNQSTFYTLYGEVYATTNDPGYISCSVYLTLQLYNSNTNQTFVAWSSNMTSNKYISTDCGYPIQDWITPLKGTGNYNINISGVSYSNSSSHAWIP